MCKFEERREVRRAEGIGQTKLFPGAIVEHQDSRCWDRGLHPWLLYPMLYATRKGKKANPFSLQAALYHLGPGCVVLFIAFNALHHDNRK